MAQRQSIVLRSTEREESLVLEHHRMAHMPRSLSDKCVEDKPAWKPLHRACHRALSAGETAFLSDNRRRNGPADQRSIGAASR